MYAKNSWKKYQEQDHGVEDVFAFNELYKDFITKGKTERACVKEALLD